MAGRRYVIRGSAVLSMDARIGDFAEADILVDGKRIAAVGRNIDAGDAEVIEAAGMIVMPGFTRYTPDSRRWRGQSPLFWFSSA